MLLLLIAVPATAQVLYLQQAEPPVVAGWQVWVGRDPSPTLAVTISKPNATPAPAGPSFWFLPIPGLSLNDDIRVKAYNAGGPSDFSNWNPKPPPTPITMPTPQKPFLLAVP